MNTQQFGDALLSSHQRFSFMSDPMTSTEVAIEQRLVGLYSATKTLRDLSRDPDGRQIIGRQRCIEDIELVRDQLSRILDDVGGK